MLGDKYVFHCKKCGAEWSTDSDANDETDKYLEEQRCLSLLSTPATLIHAPQQEQDKFINELLMIADSIEDEFNKELLYKALAYSYLQFKNDPQRAREAIDKALELRAEDDASYAIKGMTYPVCDKAWNNYQTMKYLVKYKDVANSTPASTHFTKAQFEDRFAELETHYVDHFLDIPTHNRKFLVFDDELRVLPKSFVVLPLDRLPQDLLLPANHPQQGILYVVHPYKPAMYIPYDEYQIRLFSDELHEFVYIMDCLGAKHISYKEVHAQEDDDQSRKQQNAEISGKYKGVGASVNAQREREESEYQKLKKELEEHKMSEKPALGAKPFLPKDIVWYNHRAEWQRDCNSRLNFRLVKSKFIFKTDSISAASSQEKMNIEADLKAVIVKANGKYSQDKSISLRNAESHTWELSVEFYPRECYEQTALAASPTVALSNSTPTTSQSKPNFVMIALLAVIAVLVAVLIIVLI